LKIQTDDLESIVATSADNIEMNVTSTMNWKITDVVTAATNAAETMATSGRAGDVSADITKLRGDVRKQAIASLAGFIGTVNFSATFHMSADNQRKNAASTQSAVPADAVAGGMDGNEAKADIPEATLGVDNPMFDSAKMYSAVEHANAVTRTYGVEVMSINIISATPVDTTLTRALASGAVASAEALMAETTARGNARAANIIAESEAECSTINASSKAESDVILANGAATAEIKRAEGAKSAADLLSQNQTAVELTKMDRSARMLKGGEKYFFGESPEMLSNIILKGAV
jgi:regulator of protease activity HflC (stomatin/prohibitin superfamily)